MMVMNIIHDSIVDGDGLRSVLFLSGCPHRCFGCHNEQSWNMSNGVCMSVDEVYQELNSNSLTDITISGGEPFVQSKELLKLIEKLKDKNVWCYTGYDFERLLENEINKKILSYIDVLVDGKFEIEKRDLDLIFKGSSNQRIIDVPASLKTETVVLYKK